MAKFDPFKFLQNRRHKIPPTEEELATFDMYMTQMVLSMAGHVNVLDAINTREFFSLPKNIQCMAFTSFDGIGLSSNWKKSKGGHKAISDTDIDMLMKLYKMSRSEAESCIKFKSVDMNEVVDLYTRIYEPEKYAFRKAKVPKKGTNKS